MTLAYPNPNYVVPHNCDKMGALLLELKDRLVATGFWRVRGSGTGFNSAGVIDVNSTFQSMGQTAGVNGSYDVLTNYNTGPVRGTSYNTGAQFGDVWAVGGAGSISRYSAWYVLEEIASGRCLFVRRYPSATSGSNYYGVIAMAAGCASTGAMPVSPPAAITPSPRTILGTLPASWAAWSTDLDASNGIECVMQLGVAADVTNGVAPFWFTVFSRSTGTHTLSMYYDALVDGPTTDAFVLAGGSWVMTFGGQAFAQSTSVSAVPAGGATFAARPLATYRAAGSSDYPSATPAIYAQAVGNDGKWRALPIHVVDANGRYHGRMRHFLTHPINRDYPTTYNVATPGARLALGLMCVEWKQNTVPLGSP